MDEYLIKNEFLSYKLADWSLGFISYFETVLNTSVHKMYIVINHMALEINIRDQ